MSKVGKFKHGQVKRTDGQRKKHVSQMSEYELHRLCRRIKGLKRLRASSHLSQKVKRKEISFTYDMIWDVLKNIHKSHIIEYNLTMFNEQEESRVLLRTHKSYPVQIDGKGEVRCNLCFVLSLNRGNIITAYWNEVDDNHTTINLERYDENLKIV